ncbi:sulfatase-like hydrolase/transferase, partial [Myxococcota bacterium]|nr:sulfatase-like hydrolase/transferase [Myxococcota bacterium]
AALARAVAPEHVDAPATALVAAGGAWTLLRTSITRTTSAVILWGASTLVSLHALVLSSAGVTPARDHAAIVLGAALGVLTLAKLASLLSPAARRRDGFFGAAAYPRHFLGLGRLPRGPFEPRPEHRAYLSGGTAVPQASAEHGRLRGANVLVVTLESVGRTHLARHGGGAVTPFLDGLFDRGITSLHHLCITPNTNEAHVAIYGSDYLAPERVTAADLAPTRALFAGGYTGVYLTAADTADYGLRGLVEAAGFTHVVDREDLTPGPLDGARPSDVVLPREGLDRAAAIIDALTGPWLLHVHLSNTHVPYRVVDPRFRRRDHARDLDRFLDGIEETDAILGELFASLEARGLLEGTLVIVSSDHGQAFGELGYLSHASAVIAPQVDVPFVLLHPELSPRTLALSTHFDVMPTILDLVGLGATAPASGRSVFAPQPPPCVLLSAGHPSRARASNFGLVVDGRKYMVDLVSGRCYELRWNDELLRELEGDERVYWTLLLHQMLMQRGIS